LKHASSLQKEPALVKVAYNPSVQSSAGQFSRPAPATEEGRGWRNYVERKTGIPLTSKGISAFRGGAGKGVKNIKSWGADPGRLVRGVGGAISTIPTTGAAFLSENVGRPVERFVTGDDTIFKSQQKYWGDTRDAAGAAAGATWTPGGGDAMQQYKNIDKYTQPGALRDASQGALAVGSTAATLAPVAAGAQLAAPLAREGAIRLAAGTGNMGVRAAGVLAPVLEGGRRQFNKYAPQVQLGVHQANRGVSAVENSPLWQGFTGPKGATKTRLPTTRGPWRAIVDVAEGGNIPPVLKKEFNVLNEATQGLYAGWKNAVPGGVQTAGPRQLPTNRADW